MPSAPLLRRAFVDESFLEAEDRGFYVLAAAAFDAHCEDDVRALLLRVRGTRRVRKVHWNEMDRAQQVSAATQLAEVAGLHVVTVGTPVPPKRQERARAKCLHRLVHECAGLGIADLVLESRTVVLDRRDNDVMRGVRFGLPAGPPVTVRHQPGAEEPLLWAADIVAGAVRAALEGRPAARDAFGDRVRQLDVSTDC